MAAVLVGCPETTPVQVASRTFTLKSAKFGLKVDPDRRHAVASASYDMKEITAKIVAAGTVTADIDSGSAGKEWSPLPLTLRFTDPNGASHAVAIQLGYQEGKFTVLMRGDHQSALASVLEVEDYKLRVVVIHGQAADG